MIVRERLLASAAITAPPDSYTSPPQPVHDDEAHWRRLREWAMDARVHMEVLYGSSLLLGHTANDDEVRRV